MKKAFVVTLAVLFLVAGLAIAGDKAPTRTGDQTGTISLQPTSQPTALETHVAQSRDAKDSQCTQLSQAGTVGLTECNSNCQACCYGDCLQACSGANCCCPECAIQVPKPEDRR